MRRDGKNFEVAQVLSRMRPLIEREFNITLDADDQDNLASFALYGMKSTDDELNHLVNALLGLKPELQIVRSLAARAVDRVKTGFPANAPALVALRKSDNT